MTATELNYSRTIPWITKVARKLNPAIGKPRTGKEKSSGFDGVESDAPVPAGQEPAAADLWEGRRQKLEKVMVYLGKKVTGTNTSSKPACGWQLL